MAQCKFLFWQKFSIPASNLFLGETLDRDLLVIEGGQMRKVPVSNDPFDSKKTSQHSL